MKKLVIAGLLGLGISQYSQAQDLKSIEKFLLLRRYKDAKTEIDKVMADPKFNTKPEAWISKALIYSENANDSTVSKKDSAIYRTASFDALKKYAELDPTKALASDPKYANVSWQLYAANYNLGFKRFNEKDWQGAFDNFKNAVMLSEYVIKNKIIAGPFDTTSILYAGASAQNMKKDDEAVPFFTRLADAKIVGKENEFLYQFLASYYLQKRDEPNFRKYEQLGKKLYPDSKYFSTIGSDFARSSSDFNDVIKYYEEKMASEPSNYELAYNFGVEIYGHLLKDTLKKTATDEAEWEKKMIIAFEKASSISPDRGMPFYAAGAYYLKKSDRINDSIEMISAQIKAANAGAKPDKKTGKLPSPPKELLTARKTYFDKYYSIIDDVTLYFEKANLAFAKKSNLEPVEKSDYKNASNNLIEIYRTKASNAVGKPAEVAKYTAAQKKWEQIYDTIK